MEIICCPIIDVSTRDVEERKINFKNYNYQWHYANSKRTNDVEI